MLQLTPTSEKHTRTVLIACGRIVSKTNYQKLIVYFVFFPAIPPTIAELLMNNIQAVLSIPIGILVIIVLIATVAYQSKWFLIIIASTKK